MSTFAIDLKIVCKKTLYIIRSHAKQLDNDIVQLKEDTGKVFIS
jgi:hypothetical protein